MCLSCLLSSFPESQESLTISRRFFPFLIDILIGDFAEPILERWIDRLIRNVVAEALIRTVLGA